MNGAHHLIDPPDLPLFDIHDVLAAGTVAYLTSVLITIRRPRSSIDPGRQCRAPAPATLPWPSLNPEFQVKHVPAQYPGAHPDQELGRPGRGPETALAPCKSRGCLHNTRTCNALLRSPHAGTDPTPHPLITPREPTGRVQPRPWQPPVLHRRGEWGADIGGATGNAGTEVPPATSDPPSRKADTT